MACKASASMETLIALRPTYISYEECYTRSTYPVMSVYDVYCTSKAVSSGEANFVCYFIFIFPDYCDELGIKRGKKNKITREHVGCQTKSDGKQTRYVYGYIVNSTAFKCKMVRLTIDRSSVDQARPSVSDGSCRIEKEIIDK